MSSESAPPISNVIAAPVLDVSISDNHDPDLPILLKIDDRSGSTVSHVDENNENDAVGSTRTASEMKTSERSLGRTVGRLARR